MQPLMGTGNNGHMVIMITRIDSSRVLYVHAYVGLCVPSFYNWIKQRLKFRLAIST